MDIHRSALSLVIHKNGNVSECDIDYVLDFYRSNKGISIDAEKYREAVKRACSNYDKHANKLFICTDEPCLKKTFINPAGYSIETLSRKLKCPVETTGCHWHCDSAPVMTLKSDNRSNSFIKCSAANWQSVYDSISSFLSGPNHDPQPEHKEFK